MTSLPASSLYRWTSMAETAFNMSVERICEHKRSPRQTQACQKMQACIDAYRDKLPDAEKRIKGKPVTRGWGRRSRASSSAELTIQPVTLRAECPSDHPPDFSRFGAESF